MVASLDDISSEVGKIIPKPNPALMGAEVRKAMAIVDRILSASDAEIGSRKFLLGQFHEYGMPVMTHEFWTPWAHCMNPGGFGALQIPTEIVDCLRRVAPLNIKTAVEIGVYRGGLSYFMGAVLQRINPEFTLTLVDPWDSLLGFEDFSRKLNLKKHIPSTSADFAGQPFDFVFIDGDHTYKGAILDFYNLGRYAAKAVGFHDIHDHSEDVGTVRAWDEIKTELAPTHEIYEIAHTVPRGLGIGLAIKA